MSTTQPDSLSRLRAANPAPVQADLGRELVAQATLERILADEHPPTPRPRRRIHTSMPRGLGVALAVVVVGAGAAFAATNPFGWWSANPDTARYAVNPAVHVRTPSAAEIVCRRGTTGGFACGEAGSGQRYMRIDSVQLSGPASFFTRVHFRSAIATALAKHQISSAQAARFRADVAAVPDSFFPEFRLAMRYQTISGGGNGRVPPPGIPQWLVCQNAGAGLSCADLNGDEHAPVGAGIYTALPARDWRLAPPHRRDAFMPPGISFTRSEYRLLFDLIANATVTGGGGSPTSGSATATVAHADRAP
jgi:hypothetical protein